jgi:hypothetical protein
LEGIIAEDWGEDTEKRMGNKGIAGIGYGGIGGIGYKGIWNKGIGYKYSPLYPYTLYLYTLFPLFPYTHIPSHSFAVFSGNKKLIK